ncbi:lantibiotic dehydratase [Streptomyces anulatus]
MTDTTVTLAPYALVRTVALPAPQPSLVATEYREHVGRLTALLLRCERVGPELCDTLYDVAGTGAADLRSRVLVPLRRDVYNRRSPRPALRASLGQLPQQLPLLDAWLSARDEIDRITETLSALTTAALEADRVVLAALCASEELQRAVAGTSEDLLRAVRRTAAQGGVPDKQSRKSEATVLRYAMRAVTKTVPLSWFSHVGWGQWRKDSGGLQGITVPTATAQVERHTLDSLVQAVLQNPQLRAALGHQLAAGLRIEGPNVRYSRIAGKTQLGMDREEQVVLPLTAPLRGVLAEVARVGAVRPGDLAANIAVRLPLPPERAELAAAAYVDGLIEQKVLRPLYPFDPQARDIVGEATQWLAGLGRADLASVVAAIGAETQRYAHLPAAARPQALARIWSRWSEAFALAGSAPGGRRAPLSEDVTTPAVLELGVDEGSGALPDLARLGPLFELFDGYSVVRRVAQDRFVARFGAGGSCDSLSEFADVVAEAWQALAVVGEPGDSSDRSLSLQVRALLRLRAELAAAVPAAGPDGEVVMPDRVADEAARRRPAWLLNRPVSYGVLVQPVPAFGTTRLCVNHVYGGWGRFTSRFLDQLDPSAREQVSAQITAALDGTERVAQIRPVAGFNANLHPLLVADEVSENQQWSKLQPEELQLVHDIASDQLRLRVTATGELINVLYLGFLMPFVLPVQWMPMLNDLGSGLVDLGEALVPGRDLDTVVGRVRHRPRLRYRDVIVSRARWQLSPELVHAWHAELDQGEPAQVAARWRAALGLPEHVFVCAADPEAAAGMSAIMSYLGQPKSQYVDLGSALHLRCLARTLARYMGSLVIEEALPEPRAGVRAVEILAETYRRRP